MNSRLLRRVPIASNNAGGNNGQSEPNRQTCSGRADRTAQPGTGERTAEASASARSASVKERGSEQGTRGAQENRNSVVRTRYVCFMAAAHDALPPFSRFCVISHAIFSISTARIPHGSEWIVSDTKITPVFPFRGYFPQTVTRPEP
jgi:hypothetical protein